MWIGSLMPEGALTLALPSRTKGEGLSVLPEVRRCLGARTAAQGFRAWLIGHALDHHHEQYTAFIPPAQPAHTPAIQVNAHLDRPAKP